MPRSMFAGSTDYSHQSLDDIIIDLNNWATSLESTIAFLDDSQRELDANGFWERVNIDFVLVVLTALKFYRTALSEIREIRNEIPLDIKQHHVARLARLGKTSRELDLEFGSAWHKKIDPYTTNDDYRNPNFQMLERMYARGRDMAIDTIDLSNVAARLADYVGRKQPKITSPDFYDEWKKIHPNLAILMQRIDNALARGDYSEVIYASASIFETVAKDIINVPSVQDQTLKSFFERYRKDSRLSNELLNYILAIYDSRSTTPLAGHGSTKIPEISKEQAVLLVEMTKAFVRVEYKLKE
jgi:hypothetical protein